MAVGIEGLMRLTEKFFQLHWNDEAIGREPPLWSEPFSFKGGSAPNYDKQGLYAFLKHGEITYIGVGAALGKPPYEGHGIGKRLQSYTKIINGVFTLTDARLADAGSIVTIGFEKEHAYLALALESYLIGRMPTIHNVNRQGRPAVQVAI